VNSPEQAKNFAVFASYEKTHNQLAVFLHGGDAVVAL
jgi:hypothetical protein